MIAHLLTPLGRLWLASLRTPIDFVWPEGPVVWGVWHRDVVWGAALFRPRPVSALVSPSADGQILSRILSGHAMQVVPGSSNQRAISGARRMLRLLREGQQVATTFDGPKGPAGIAKEGPLWLASQAGCPLLELQFDSPDRWQLKDWSGLRMPFPGSRAVVRVIPR